MATSESVTKPETGNASTKLLGTEPQPSKANPNAVPTRPGFKLVKLRMPDGTIKRAWRPIANEAEGSKTHDTTEVTRSNEPPAPAAVSKPVVSNTKPESLNTTSSEDKPPSYTAAIETKPTTSTATAASSPAKKAVGEPKKGNAPPVVAEPSATPTIKSTTALPTTTPTANVFDTTRPPAQRGRRSRLRRFWVGVGQTLAPELYLGHIDTPHAGDEIISDDDWPSDSDDSDDERDRNQNRRRSTQGQGAGADRLGGGQELDGDIGFEGEDSGERRDDSRAAGRDGLSTNEKHLASTSGIPINKSPPSQRANVNEKSGGATVVAEKEIKVESEKGKLLKALEKEAHPLHRPSSITQLVMWTILMGFPLLYIALGIETATLWHTPVFDSSGAMIRRGVITQQVIKIAVTAWPIIFAAILAQSLKAYATYRVEKKAGIELMALEQLISSSSLASAIKQPFFLWRFDFVAIALLCLWSLQPVASQGMQNMLYTVPRYDPPFEKIIPYMDLTKFNPTFYEQGPTSDSESTTGSLNIRGPAVAFAAALLPRGNVAKSGVDPYTYPLLPAMHYLDAWYKSNVTSDGWYDASDAVNTGLHASLYGIVVNNPAAAPAPQGTTAILRLTSSYFRFICSRSVRKAWSEIDNTSTIWWASQSGTLWFNLRTPLTLSNFEGQKNEELLWTGYGNLTLLTTLVDSTAEPNSTVAFSTCQINQTFVEAELQCGSDKCIVTRMRPIEHRPAHALSSEAFSDPFVQSTGQFFIARNTNSQGPSLTGIETYLKNPNRTLTPAVYAQSANEPDMLHVSVYDFEQRMAIMFNTFWHMGFGPEYQTGVTDAVLTNPNQIRTPWANTTATITNPPTDIYELSIGWLVTLFISSLVLFLAGFATAWWEHHTIGPDILGFASSIVRQSKYISVPKGTSGESGAERANRLKDHKVMMQDVRPSGPVGKIALGTATETSVPLKPGKLYR